MRGTNLLIAFTVILGIASGSALAETVDPSDSDFAIDGNYDGNFTQFSNVDTIFDNGNIESRFAAEFDLRGINGVTGIDLEFPNITIVSAPKTLRVSFYEGNDDVTLPDFSSTGTGIDFSATALNGPMYDVPATNEALMNLTSSTSLGVVLQEVDTGLSQSATFLNTGAPAQLMLTRSMPIEIPIETNAPTLDGNLGRSEWASAYTADISIAGAGGEQPVTLYLMTDLSFLYVAIAAPGATQCCNYIINFRFEDERAAPGSDPAEIFDGFLGAACPSDEGLLRMLPSATQFVERNLAGSVCSNAVAPGIHQLVVGPIFGGGATAEARIDLVSGPLDVAPGERFGAFIGLIDNAPAVQDFIAASIDPALESTPLAYTPFQLPEPTAALAGVAALTPLLALRRARSARGRKDGDPAARDL